MKIKIKNAWGQIKELEVLEVIPHGGYTDEPLQYKTSDGYFTPKNVLEVIND